MTKANETQWEAGRDAINIQYYVELAASYLADPAHKLTIAEHEAGPKQRRWIAIQALHAQCMMAHYGVCWE